MVVLRHQVLDKAFLAGGQFDKVTDFSCFDNRILMPANKFDKVS